MIDNAAIFMQNGKNIATERICSINDNVLQSHFHTYYELFYLEKGQRNVVIGNSSYCMEPHDFIVFPPYTMHHSYSAEDVKFERLVLYFQPELISPELQEKFKGDLTPHHMGSDSHKELFHQLLCQMIQEQDSHQDFAHVAMQALLQLIVIGAARAKSNTHQALSEPKMASIISYVHQHYFQEISLDELCERFFISKSYLCREFKRFTCCSFVEYINKIRILHAQRLFVESNKTITEIAIEVGFGSLTHFERVFIKNNNQSPKKFCTQIRKMRDSKNLLTPTAAKLSQRYTVIAYQGQASQHSSTQRTTAQQYIARHNIMHCDAIQQTALQCICLRQ